MPSSADRVKADQFKVTDMLRAGDVQQLNDAMAAINKSFLTKKHMIGGPTTRSKYQGTVEKMQKAVDCIATTRIPYDDN